MPRSTRGLRANVESAIADIAARKASGKTRTADYQIHEEADIYETVDEATYAAIAAVKRKETRDFIAPNDGNDDEYVMEQEFEMEDELSLFRSERERKRKRVSAPRRAQPVPTKRVATAFFNTFQTSAPHREAEDTDAGPRILDTSMLDEDLDNHLISARAIRKKKRVINQSVGDLLFDAPAPQHQPHVLQQHFIPSQPIQQELDEYEAPPPTLSSSKPPLPGKPLEQSSTSPKLELDDSIDADALLAVADAAVTEHRKSTTVTSKVATSLMMPTPMLDQRLRTNFNRQPQTAAPTYPQVNLPLARDPQGRLLMFWTDAHEMRVNGGQHLYLFGKVALGSVQSNKYASVCVQVRGMERVLYVLPRKTKRSPTGATTGQPVTIVPDVHAEVTKILLGGENQRSTQLGGTNIHSGRNLPKEIKAKIVVRSCPFGDLYAPREPTEYLKLKIPYQNTNRLSPESSGETFSRVYGTRTSSSESLCLKRKLRGPGWVWLTNAAPLQTKVSHAKFTLSIPSPEDLHVALDLTTKAPPPVTSLCIQAKTVLNNKSGAHEIVMVSGVFLREVPLSGPLEQASMEPGGPQGTRDFVLIRAPERKSIPFGFSDRARCVLARAGDIEVVSSESALLNNLLTRILRLDPDVILGHHIMGFGLDVLLCRMHARRCREWSRLGRLVQRRDLSHVIKSSSEISSWFKSDVLAGRLVVDTHMHASDLLPKEKDYSLSSLSQNVLGAASPGRQKIFLRPSTDVSKIQNAFENTSSLCELVSECSEEARTVVRLAAHLSVLPLTRQLTCISGNLWSQTLRGSRAERIEYLLAHEFKMIGSKNGGNASSAGNVGGKLLLPDKLNRGERESVVERRETEQRMARKADTPLATGNDHGYGNPGNSNGGPGPEGGKEPVAKEGQNGKTKSKRKSARRKPQYSGGLVLEPIKGFYDRYVLQLDFNSLYPSIIQEFNLCFTTLTVGESRSDNGSLEKNRDTHVGGLETGAPASAELPSRSTPEGVLPRVLRRLVEQRKQVKALLKDERKRAGRETLRAQQLDIRQLAIKLTANSLYGCLGFESGRFFARGLAEMVTSQGRGTLQSTVDLARDTFNMKVIYGDTDSLFVYTGLEDIAQVRKLGHEFKREVNKKYRTLEIEIDAIYRKMLLLRKKKYAALKIVDPNKPEHTVREVKGIDLVRHDWCDLSHEASDHFINQIFKGQSANVDDAVGNILAFLNNLASSVRKNDKSLSKYVITRALNKRPQDYPDGHTTPHVAVASRLMKREKRAIKQGEYIKYVICASEDGVTGASGIAARAYHPDEVKESKGKLKIDVRYYLENQVLPPILRLCDPIEGVEPSCIAVSLGLDGRRYERRDNENTGGAGEYALGSRAAAEKFRDVEPFMISCALCKTSNEFEGIQFKPSGDGVRKLGLECAGCSKRFPTARLHNAIILTTRKWVRKYYTSEMIIDAKDGSRKRVTRNVVLGANGLMATRKFSEAWLHRQLRYLYYLMDVEERWQEIRGVEQKELPLPQPDAYVYLELRDRVQRIFDANGYRFISLSQFLIPLGVC